jgi:hypothetical protein
METPQHPLFSRITLCPPKKIPAKIFSYQKEVEPAKIYSRQKGRTRKKTSCQKEVELAKIFLR